MSVYHTSFNYLDKKSFKDYGLVISHFADNADSGEVETFMSMDPIYTDNAHGTRRIDYGAKYSSVAVFRITVLKQDGSAMSVSDIRSYLKWLTGARNNSPLELLINDEVKYFFIGRFTNAWHYKMDAKTIGLILEFTSISPWAYSKYPAREVEFNGKTVLTINNASDDLYEYVYPKITYTNSSNDGIFQISNDTTGEKTSVTGLGLNETITIDNNFMITTDKPSKVFGTDFNFVFPRLKPGMNQWTITGRGKIVIDYIMYFKVGDCARDINSVSDPICNEDGQIVIDTLDWSRISNTPTTIAGYGLSNDISNHFYNKIEINNKFDAVYENIKGANKTFSDINEATLREMDNRFKNVYTKSEIDNKNDIIYLRIESLNQYADSIMNDTSYIGTKLDQNYYTKQYIDAYFYNKIDADKKITELANKNYTKAQIDSMFKSTDVQINTVRNLFNNVYTKKEADYKNSALDAKISEANNSIEQLRLYAKTIKDDTSSNYYAKPYIDDNFYTKRDIDSIVEELNRDPSTGEATSVSWIEITGKPTTLAGYQIKNEVVDLINSSINSLEIDEGELNQMLVEVFG